MPKTSDVVVCSFYTDDDYYRTHGESLRRNLDRLGVEHDVRVVQRASCRASPPT